MPALTGLDLLEELGKGGMGVVHKAYDKALGRFVALKRLKSEGNSPRMVRRFYQEARSAAQLSHPYVVPIYAVGQYEGEPCFTMQFVAGGSLSRRRDEYRDPRKAAALLEKVARGVHAAHLAGVVHRDLKPGNILLDEAGEPQVADFGLAKLAGAGAATKTGDLLGTLWYMAPEQVSGHSHQVTAATDIWSLGIVLYELLMGRRPFLGNNFEVARAIQSQDVPRPGELPAGLRTIVLCALEKDASLRYATAEAFAEDLQRWLDGKPVLGRQVSWYKKAERFIRRRATAGAALAILMAALAGIAVMRTPAAAETKDAADDPEVLDKQTIAKLKNGEAVTLIDEKHWPKKLRWLTSPAAPVDTLDSGLTYSTLGRSLLLLLADQPLPEFRLQAEVLIRNAVETGRVGLFFHHGSFPSGLGREHIFADFKYNDYEIVPPSDRVVGLSVQRYGREPAPVVTRDAAPTLAVLLAKLPSGGLTYVRRNLQLIVTRKEIVANFDGLPVQKWSRVQYDKQRSNRLISGGAPPDMPIYPNGGLGLIWTKASATFTKVVIEPIDMERKP